MLKTNTKKARENIRKYIMDNFDCSNYDMKDPNTWEEIARAIWDTFQEEKFYSMEYVKAHKMTTQDVFTDWAAGLPSILDTCYYYNRSAVDDLAVILEETEEEKKKYNDRQKAESLLTYLIFREIQRAIA